MKQKKSYSYQDLIDCGNGLLFGEGNAKLPLPPMLMFDRITKIENDTGEFKKGLVEAELDIKEDLWFFKCHFQNDPVMPGCLGLDAMWQLVGFYLGWTGEPGKGRALGVSTVKFTGEVLKKIKKALVDANGGTGSKKNNVSANDDFLNKMKKGDIIIAKKGRRELLGYGIVKSDYIYEKKRKNYNSIRQVEWKLKGNWKI